MTTPLFLDAKLQIDGAEKYAGLLTPMSDNQDRWPQEVMEEAYRQLPYLSDFAVHVSMDRADEERGYALGSIEVQSNTQQTPDEMERLGTTKTVQIPFVVREKKLAPLDIFLSNGKYHHLVEGRLRAAMFRGDTFDAVRDRPPEPNLYTDLQPPLEASTGLQGGGFKVASAKKEASIVSSLSGLLGRKAPQYIPVDTIRGMSNRAHDVSKFVAARGSKATGLAKAPNLAKATSKPLQSASSIRGAKIAMMTPLLPQLHGRVNELHLNRMKLAMKDPSTLASYMNANEGVKAAFDSALGLEASDLRKTASVAWSSIKPNVVQLRKLASGNYLMKYANSEMYAPQQEEVPPSVAEEMMPDLDSSPQIAGDGTITASPDVVDKQTTDTEEIRTVDQPGVWKVQDKMGNMLTGWCFPQLLSLDMQPMPLTLFSNGSEYSLQENIAGVLITKGSELPKGRMQGYGALYYLDHATPRVFVPMTIKNSYRGPDGLFHYMAVTDLGEEVDLSFCDSLKTIVRVSDREFCLPEEFAKWWMPLKSKTELVDQPLLFTKFASAQPYSAKGEIISDGSLFSFRGEPFSKVASSEVSFLGRQDAEFVGVAAGIDSSQIKQLLTKAAQGNLVKVDGLRTLWDPSEKIARMKKKIASLIQDVGLRNYNLIKEASVLDDALTADKVLGLGFLNAENVATFVDLLPGLEYALSKIAEMLMASRVGLKDIPEVALERMMIALEDVIQGLKTLKQREISYVE